MPAAVQRVFCLWSMVPINWLGLNCRQVGRNLINMVDCGSQAQNSGDPLIKIVAATSCNFMPCYRRYVLWPNSTPLPLKLPHLNFTHNQFFSHSSHSTYPYGSWKMCLLSLGVPDIPQRTSVAYIRNNTKTTFSVLKQHRSDIYLSWMAEVIYESNIIVFIYSLWISTKCVYFSHIIIIIYLYWGF